MIAYSIVSRHFYIALALVALLGLSGILLLRHLLPPRAIEELTYVPKKEVITPEIRQLQTYIRIDTTNPPGNETAGAKFLLSELEKHGINAELIESAPGRGSLYARIRGTRPGEGLLLLNHIDVVDADPKLWKYPPFAAQIVSNEMYGRGTLDMKGIGLCHLNAFIALAESKTRPVRDVVFLAVADEEAGGKAGIDWLLNHRPDIFEGIRYAINEGGVTETVAGAITYFGLETGSKQFVTVQLHAPERASLERARLALEPYFDSRDSQRLLPEVAEYFRDLAPHRTEIRGLLTDIQATIANQRFWLVPGPYRELTQDNVYVFGIEKSDKDFSVKTILLDLPDDDPAVRIAWLTSVVKPFGVSVEPVRLMGPAPISSPRTPFFALMASSIQEEYGKVPVGPMILPRYATDCRYLRARGVQCYGMWPYPVDLYQTSGIHGIDERIRLDWYMEGIEMTRKLVARYAAGA